MMSGRPQGMGVTEGACEPCIICQPAARAALDPDTRAMMEELVADYPPSSSPMRPRCWNCDGRQVVEATRPVAVCIGCGCDDLHACVREIQLDDLIEPNFEDGSLVEAPRKVAAMEPCHWLRLDRGAGLGVCSACPGSVERWDAGDRRLDDDVIY